MQHIVTAKHLLSERDELGGIPLKDGEKIQVQFPDGTEIETNVIVRQTLVDHKGPVPDHHLFMDRSFLELKVHGAVRWITAAGLMAARKS